jgi:hypothetical protein
MKMIATLRALLAAALLLLGGCTVFAAPKELDVRTTRLTAKGQFEVTIRPMTTDIPVNRLHAWEIVVKNAKGEPVTGARIGFDGGMPQHFHGFPTQPRVTADLGNGRYRLDGVKFSMTGWWEMKLDIQAADLRDAVTFNTVVVTKG